jgi:tetratricopeptide (TPR) repeat protein
LDKLRNTASRQFTDREAFTKAFQDVLPKMKASDKELPILVFYGVGGIGKTRLLRELSGMLDADKSPSLWVLLNFEEHIRDMQSALFHLRKLLNAKYKIQFPTFDLAYAIFWQKTHPQTPLSKESFPLMEDGTLITDIISALGVFPAVGLITKIPAVIMRGHQVYKEWWTRRSKELHCLTEMESGDIADLLPSFWAQDFNDYLNQHKKHAVIFLDTYEALWENEHSEARFFERDEWVRELMSNLPGVLWAIAGREKLRWEEVDQNWGECLDQHLVGNLSKEDCLRFLESCAVTDTPIQQAIIEGSQGTPYYLDLMVDTYEEIIRKGEQPSVDDFEKTPKKIFDRFLRYLDRSETETLKVLASARFWDEELFCSLIDEFHTGYPATALPELCRFSFVNEGETARTWRMHQLMRMSLQEHQDQQLLQRVSRFLFDYYNKELEQIDIKAITDKQKIALPEAFQHAKAVYGQDIESLLEWFDEKYYKFSDAAKWALLLPLCQELLQIAEKELSPDDSGVAASLNKLAFLYSTQGRYEEAESLYKRALAIREKTLGPDKLLVAEPLNNLAILYSYQGRYEEAESLYKRALAIYEKKLPPDHPDVAASLNNLAILYSYQGRYEEAESLYKRALSIREKALGPDHPDVAASLNNLAWLYSSHERYDEAEPFFKRALAIYEKNLPPDHPEVATSLNNLAELCISQGRYDEAESLHKRALSIREKTLGPDLPTVAASFKTNIPLYGSPEQCYEAKPGMNIGLVVNARGKVSLVHDKKFDEELAYVAYHVDTKHLEIFFLSGRSYRIDWEATDEMHNFLLKIRKILVILMKEKKPVEGYDTCFIFYNKGKPI